MIPPLWWRTRRDLTDPGCFSEMVSSFSVTCQKTKQKKTPVSRVSCASHFAWRLPDDTMLAASPGLCGRSTRKLARLLVGSNSPRAYFRPHRRCSARDNGKEANLNHKDRFQAPYEGATLGLPLCGWSLIFLPAQHQRHSSYPAIG